jgi:DNA-binding transcriptional MocR family regulator
MQVRGRYLVIGWTAVFLTVAGAIVLRARRGYEVRDRLLHVRDSVQAMRATRDKVHRAISTLENRAVLEPRLELLGLRSASDSEIKRVQLPPDR